MTTRSGAKYQMTDEEKYELERKKRMNEYDDWVKSLSPEKYADYYARGYFDNNHSGGYKKKRNKSKKRNSNSIRNTRRRKGRRSRRR